ncbi:hypothetical protein BJV78DRAFT_1151650 [Lactifluus subvellereus]|nr:hypothetical protein BJV78DRAFT_1151650 [Lactifluus subvellereus]
MIGNGVYLWRWYKQPMLNTVNTGFTILAHIPLLPLQLACHPANAKESASLSQRLMALMKAYRCYAVGAYTVLSIVDFTIAITGVNLLGVDYVSSVAASAKACAQPGREEIEEVLQSMAAGVQERLYAMLLLAWTVYKTLFIPVRIGLTAAFTPRIGNWLCARGWAGGKGTRRAMQEMREQLRDHD